MLTREDIIAIIKYLIELINSKSDVDDIDHLSNRRVRTVGEQLYNQFGVEPCPYVEDYPRAHERA